MRLFIVLFLSLLTFPLAATEDPKPEPGKRFTIAFPELGEASHGGVVRMEAYIPEDYVPGRPFPLLTWFGGGYGDHNPDPAISITGNKGFVCVGLSYRKGIDPMEKGFEESVGGLWSTPWWVFRTMLERLERIVPNIDAKRRICSGFSSGGAAVCYLIGYKDPGFCDYYAGFMPGGAGWDMGGLSRLKGRPMLIFMGDQDSRIGGYRMLNDAGKAAGVDIHFLEMKGVGHDTPARHQLEIRQWMVDQVLRRGHAQQVAALPGLGRAGKWPQVAELTQDLLRYAEPGSPTALAASEWLGKSQAFCVETMRTQLAKRNPADMRRVLKDWPDWPQTAELRAACDQSGSVECTKLLSGTPDREALRRFLRDWSGFPCRQAAQQHWDQLATQDGDKLKPGSGTSRLADLERFVKRWEQGAAVEKAQAEILAIRTELGNKDVEAARSIKDVVARLTRLNVLAAREKIPLPALVEARETAAAELIGQVRRMPDQSQHRKAYAEIARMAEGTKSGAEAAKLAQ